MGKIIIPRDQVWAAIRELKEFTNDDLYFEASVASRRTVRRYVQSLRAAGIIEVIGERKEKRRMAMLFRLVDDRGIEPPRIRPDGTEKIYGRARMQMWQTLRILKTFTLKELVVTASTETCQIGESHANNYLTYLEKAGYLKGTLRRGEPKQYRFIAARYKGPRPPMIVKATHVYDPNSNETVWLGEVRDDQS